MEEKEKWFETTVRVRYQETDQMQVAYHANYLVWFEVGRTEMIRQMGFSYRRFEDLGFMLPVTEANVKYKRSARYDDEVLIRTRVNHCEGVRLVLGYEALLLPDRELLASGETHHVWTSLDLKPVRLERRAPELYALMKQYEW
ncbi:thioesterase [Aneurinibacillus migulanus]|uniref:Acyl-CoA thioester hydrolase n=1 Tax=Aneurinibacillus migulanus TaxID=47500 RepID=A0A0D1VXA7_ANEMI|nr:thioesterase family protein [Aneurinibacillus migulanus]KIV50741.1 thioesterase [Aneurinibacillus migulanus]KIV50910.1 thioesterase [Aneurinibacillus migulanus]KON99334.1 thioesterase [Aneurinibacillus migulanus]KPD09652.1 thioesterase [Aneurinibacillus migulanus]MCP1354955.1 acyl-CoA thioesterase [Aneurinibacillus migulanus]